MGVELDIPMEQASEDESDADEPLTREQAIAASLFEVGHDIANWSQKLAYFAEKRLKVSGAVKKFLDMMA